MAMVHDNPLFDQWKHYDAIGSPPIPLELLVLLGSLHYIGRGWTTFDDIEEVTAASEETHRVFFHMFIWWGASCLFDKYIKTLSNVNNLDGQFHEMAAAGFPGACGSMDATNVGKEKCPYHVIQTHKGTKLALPARTYNLIVNHHCEILHTTRGHPSHCCYRYTHE